MCFSQASEQVVLMSVTCAVELHDLDRLLSAELLHCKVTVFSFAINKFHGGDTLELCRYLISPQTFSHIF